MSGLLAKGVADSIRSFSAQFAKQRSESASRLERVRCILGDRFRIDNEVIAPEFIVHTGLVERYPFLMVYGRYGIDRIQTRWDQIVGGYEEPIGKLELGEICRRFGSTIDEWYYKSQDEGLV